MMKNKLRKMKLSLGLLMTLLLLLPLASAFGVTTPYWDTKPLTMYPGATTEVNLFLQNMVGDKDITLRASIAEGEEIATLMDENLDYSIPFRTKEVVVKLKISVPEGMLPGEKQKVAVSFTQILEEEGKMVQMSGAVKTYLPVEIIQTPTGAVVAGNESLFTNTTAVILVLVVVAGAVAGYVVVKKKKKV